METQNSHIKANHIRTSCPGYIGGSELANRANNKQILDLADLQDEHAELSNRLTANRLQYANLISAIKAG